MTNRTRIFSYLALDVPTACGNITTLVNAFIATGIPLGYTNFCIGLPVITPQYLVYVGPGLPPLPYSAPSSNYFCTVEVNYYDPSIM